MANEKNKIDLQKYHTAVLAVKDAAASSTPIKRTEFITKHELTPIFFRTMEELKIIKETSANNLIGSVFSWIYQQASNEADSRVTMKLTERIQEINRAAYLKYSTPEAKEKARLRKIQRELDKERKVVSKKPFDGPSVVIKEAEPVVYEIPLSVNEDLLQDNNGPTQQEIDDFNSREPRKFGASRIKFEFEGLYSRQDVIDRILALVDDGSISSFSLNVNYEQ